MRDFKTIQIIAMTIEEMVIVQIVAMIIVLIIAIKIVQNISMVIIQIMAKEKGIFLSCLGREARGAGASLWLRPRTVEGGLWVKEKHWQKQPRASNSFKNIGINNYLLTYHNPFPLRGRCSPEMKSMHLTN